MARELTERENENLELLRKIKFLGESNFFIFCRDVCEFGYNPLPKGPRITEDQRDLCDWLQAVYEGKVTELSEIQYMILCPRGTLKSTVVQAFALWIAIKNPNIRILFYGEVHEQAQKRLAVIKRIISGCRTFRDIYGDLDGSKIKLPWNENIATLSSRKNVSIREATFECAGLDVIVNARHFDWIFPDDIHSERNSGNKDQINAVGEQIGLLTPLLDEGSKVVFAGVFWNDSDFHTRLIESKNCNVFMRSCYKDAEKTVSAFPNVFSVATLKGKREMMTESSFSCHYLLNPVNASTQAFPKIRFMPFITRGNFRSIRDYLVIDPAGDSTSENAEKRDSDYYGMEVWSVNNNHEFMLSDGFMERCGPTEAIEFALSLILKHKPYIIGIERSAQGNMKFYLQEELRKRGLFAIIVDLYPNGRSKHMRIYGWEPYTRRRKVTIAEECPIREEFLEQMSKVTHEGIKSKFDDLIDPFGYFMDLIRDYGLPGITQETNGVDIDLQNLDEVSKEYWMSLRKKEREAKDSLWASEFAS